MAIYDRSLQAKGWTEAECQAQFIRGGEAEIAETSEDLAMPAIPEIPTSPYKLPAPNFLIFGNRAPRRESSPPSQCSDRFITVRRRSNDCYPIGTYQGGF